MFRLYPAMQILISTLLYLSLHLSMAEEVKCDPKQHKYYHPQAKACMDCEKCNPGEEKIPIQEWKFPYDNVNGPTECRPCTTCKEGTFSRERFFECQKCRICSEAEVKIQNCTSTTDTVCNVRKHSPINTTTTTKATTTIEKSSTSMTTLDSRAEKQQLDKENSKRTQHLVIGFGSGISIAVVGICVLLCLCKYLTYCGFCWKGKSCSTESKVNQMEEANEASVPVTMQFGNDNMTIVNPTGPINFYGDGLFLNRENVSSHDERNASKCPLSMDPIAQTQDSVCTSIDENERKTQNPNVRYQKLQQPTSQLYKGPRVEAEHEPLLTEMNETIKEGTQVEHKCKGTPGIF